MRNLLIALKRRYPNGPKGSKESSKDPKKAARLSTVHKIGRRTAMKTMPRIDTALPLGFDETSILAGERTLGLGPGEEARRLFYARRALTGSAGKPFQTKTAFRNRR